MGVVAEIGRDEAERRQPIGAEVVDERAARQRAERHVVVLAGSPVGRVDQVRLRVVLDGVAAGARQVAVVGHRLLVRPGRAARRRHLPEEVVAGDRMRRRRGIVVDALRAAADGGEVVRQRRRTDGSVPGGRSALPGDLLLEGGVARREHGVGSVVLHPDPHDVVVASRNGTGRATAGARGEARTRNRRRRRRRGRRRRSGGRGCRGRRRRCDRRRTARARHEQRRHHRNDRRYPPSPSHRGDGTECLRSAGGGKLPSANQRARRGPGPVP